MSLPALDLSRHGLLPASRAYCNLSTAALMEGAIKRGEGELTADGSLVALTGKYTGRSPNDKFVVKDSTTANSVDWNRTQSLSPEVFGKLLDVAKAYLQGKELFVRGGRPSL